MCRAEALMMDVMWVFSYAGDQGNNDGHGVGLVLAAV